MRIPNEYPENTVQPFYGAAIATVYTGGEKLSLKTYNSPLEHTPEVGKQLTGRVMIVDCIVIVEMLVHIFSSEIFGLQVHHKQQKKIICKVLQMYNFSEMQLNITKMSFKRCVEDNYRLAKPNLSLLVGIGRFPSLLQRTSRELMPDDR